MTNLRYVIGDRVVDCLNIRLSSINESVKSIVFPELWNKINDITRISIRATNWRVKKEIREKYEKRS